MDKKELRKKYTEIRKNIGIEDRKHKSELIVKELTDLINKDKYEAILLYAPLEYEQDVLPVYDLCRKENTVCFPRVNGNEMDFFIVDSLSELEKGSFGVREPKKECRALEYKDDARYLVVVPGTVFDKNGFRIGYGKGYYDSFFAAHEGKNFFKIGICFDECLIDDFPHETQDVSVDMIISS
ncbi:MAG: 5-formyltetrahydrofolate cyclo-ligase [Lachnospiraceae bacterium]|nr:5-formyltetrahydrofolate cyclo-ligase [Lachnospiraceae bacterium]